MTGWVSPHRECSLLHEQRMVVHTVSSQPCTQYHSTDKEETKPSLKDNLVVIRAQKTHTVLRRWRAP